MITIPNPKEKVINCFTLPQTSSLFNGYNFKINFIPKIKKAANSGDSCAKATLNEMVRGYSELMEDEVLNRRKLKIEKAYRNLEQLPQSDYFDNLNLNEFGYPKVTKEEGEFYLHNNLNLERIVALRSWGYGLDLYLNWEPSIGGDKLGVRFVNFF